jgi:hypothetical protein
VVLLSFTEMVKNNSINPAIAATAKKNAKSKITLDRVDEPKEAAAGGCC